jgi:deoxyribodipyrimidine photo-lyase
MVASFLAKNLLVDWRMGERYFIEHLIDGDFASNNGGWGFSISTGVDGVRGYRRMRTGIRR